MLIAACFLMIAISFIISLPLTWVMRKMADRLGQLDAPGERKIHTKPIPVTGGVAIFWGFALPMLIGMGALAFFGDQLASSLPESLSVHLPGATSMLGMGACFLGCLFIMHVMGLIDDRKGLGPYLKLIIMIGAAVGLAAAFDVRSLNFLGLIPSIIITAFWFVTITNSFNFLDNMDGLSAGTATVCCSLFMASALASGQWFVAAVLGLLIGAMLGFLCFNFPKASIFMGDGGSLVIGFAIAFCSIRVNYFDPDLGTQWYALLTPLVVLAVPLYDITSVTIIRLSQGKSPFQGDTQHFSHRLVRKGLSRQAAVVIVWACALASGAGGILLGSLEKDWQGALVIAQCLAVLLVLALLERTPNQKEDV